MKRVIDYKEQIGIIFLLVASAFLRLYKVREYITFLGDEGRDVLVVYNILHGHLTLLGPTASVGGFFMGPIYYYFMTPFLWLFHNDPVGPAIMVGIFGTITVWLIYKIGAEFFGKLAGFFAASLYAVSPLVLSYSRSSWNPNLMPFFSLLSIYVLYKAITKQNILLFFVFGILFGVLIQLHYIVLFLAVAVITYTVVTWALKRKEEKKINAIKALTVAFIGFLLGWSPFLAFELRHGFANLQSIVTFIFHSKETGASANFLATIWNVFFRLFARLLTDFPPPNQFSLHPPFVFWSWYALSAILGLASSGVFIRACYKAYKKDSPKFLMYSAILFWFAIGIFLFGFYKKPIYDYYFEFLFPVPFLLVGNFLSSLYSLDKQTGFRKTFYAKRSKFLALGIFLILFTVNIQSLPFRYTPNNQVGQTERIAKSVLNRTGGKPFNFALITGGNSDHAYRYFFTLWNRVPVTIQNPQLDPKRQSVTDQLFVVCESLPCSPLGHSLWEIAGFGRADVASHWTETPVEIYKLVHYKGN